MGRNGILGCCFSSGHASSSAGQGFAPDDESPSDTEDHPKVSLPTPVPAPPPPSGAASSQVPSTRIPSCKLLPLPPGPAFPRHAVGIEDQVDRVIGLLEWDDEANAAVAVVLHGFGGTGKTTLADAVLATLDMQGWICFTVVPNSQNKDGSVDDVSQAERAFIYMDNDNVNALLRKEDVDVEKLLPKPYKRLRLLLTARDDIVADVISGWGIHTKVHPVEPLHYQDAMELLCNKMGVAGGTQIPQHHMSRINEILEICDGVPVVLERIAAYIRQSPDKDEAYRRVIEWSNDGNPFGSAEDRYSIESKGLLFDLEDLPPSARESFLDICSFFNGWGWDNLSCIVGEKELNSLRKRALLHLKNEESGNKVMLRPIVSRIGRNLTKGKRFTSAPELSKVLEANDQDIGRIRGIWLQDNVSEPFIVSAKTLDLMHNSLRVLALGDMTIVLDPQSCARQFKELIYFQAGRIPGIPFHSSILPELRVLDCRSDHNKNDWRLTEMSSKLTMLYLNGGRFDTGIAFGRMRDLRTLKLTEFNSFKILPEELGLLTLLEELDLGGCIKLVRLPKRLGDLKALRKLCLKCCECLQELPDSIEKLKSLKYLDLNSCTSLQQLPENFGSLSSLEELDLENCSRLKELPSSFGKLSSLNLLTLVNCTNLDHLHDDIRDLSAFVRIQFDGSQLVSIPCRLIKLVKNLSLDWCRQLTNLPKRIIEITNLRNLDFYGWSNLERLPEGFGQLKSLAELNMACCSSLQELSSDFHCLASLQILNLEWCEKLEGKWMDSLRKIKTLELLLIVGSPLLGNRWTLEMAEKREAWHFAVTKDRKIWSSVENVENMLKKAASKLLSGECLVTNSQGEPFSLSTVAPNTLLLLLYHYPCRRNIYVNYGYMWKLLEEVVKHEDPLPFQMIYVGKCFSELPKGIAERITAYASVESDAHFFFKKIFIANFCSSVDEPEFVVTEVVADEGGRKHFSTWKNVGNSFVQFLLSKSTQHSRLQELAETPQETNGKLLRALFDPHAESRASSIFLRNCTENIGVDQLNGKTVLLLITVDGHSMDDDLFNSLTAIYSKAKINDDIEIISVPIPAEVKEGYMLQRGSDLAGFESILRSVPWPVLRNPWSLKTEVYYFLIGEGHWNPTILMAVDPNGRILNRNALPLVKRWGAEVYPFTDENMKQLERRPRPQQPRQPRVDESRVKQRAEIPWAPIPVSLSDLDSTRGGFRVDAPVDLRGTSGSSIVLPVWGCEEELDLDDPLTQTALIIPGMPPRYF